MYFGNKFGPDYIIFEIYIYSGVSICLLSILWKLWIANFIINSWAVYRFMKTLGEHDDYIFYSTLVMPSNILNR